MPRLPMMPATMVMRPVTALRSPVTEAVMLRVAAAEAKAAIATTNGLKAAASAANSAWSSA